MTMEFFKGVYQCLIPRALQNSPPRRDWRIQFYLSSNPECMLSDPPLEDTPKEWTAYLDIVTSDLPGLMHDGLYLTQENVQLLENHVQLAYSDKRKRHFLRRYFTVIDPKWSGKLEVMSWKYEPVRDFRIHHLSADKVYNAQVLNKDGKAVYYYDTSNPEKNANYIYDDMPMEGLWPFPRKEEGAKDQEVLKREGEGGDQGEEKERKETEEGKEVVKDEGGGDEEEKDVEGEETRQGEEEQDGFSEWEEENPLIDSWRD